MTTLAMRIVPIRYVVPSDIPEWQFAALNWICGVGLERIIALRAGTLEVEQAEAIIAKFYALDPMTLKYFEQGWYAAREYLKPQEEEDE